LVASQFDYLGVHHRVGIGAIGVIAAMVIMGSALMVERLLSMRPWRSMASLRWDIIQML
jgi:hypothetical protein